MGDEKKPHGFGALSPEERRAMASRGGRAAVDKGVGHRFTSESGRDAGAKGGAKASREHLAAIGRKGGVTRRERAAARRTCKHTAQENVGDKIRCAYCHADLRTFVVVGGQVFPATDVVIKIDHAPDGLRCLCGAFTVTYLGDNAPPAHCSACGAVEVKLTCEKVTGDDLAQVGFL